MTNTILYHVENEVARITINRPEVSNALALETFTKISEAIWRAEADPDVRVMMLTGVGKHFSSGGDIYSFQKYLDDGETMGGEGVLATGAMARAVKKVSKPVIALINGVAAGAGAGLALACDFRVMEEQSSLLFAFINLGFVGDTLSQYTLNKMVGTAKATEIMAFGEPIKGTEALSLGLTTQLAAPGTLEATGLALAERLKQSPTFAFGKQKALNYEFFFRDLEIFTEREMMYMMACQQTADHAEAVAAFLAKRPAIFVGQ